jgi:DNA processing protein
VTADNILRLQAAVALFQELKTPAKVAKYLNGDAPSMALEFMSTMAPELLETVVTIAFELESRGIDVIFDTEPEYPSQLLRLHDAPKVLFVWGNRSLLRSASIGMCGSRKASERGLAAARKCGGAIASRGLAIVSGYATGVDTETHLGALQVGGDTIIILAEGIMHFKRKRSFAEVPFDGSHVLAVSQFAPAQPWNVGAAMTRNAMIYGLGKALVVIEAGESGGTFQAGVGALRANKPVLALGFESETPRGNAILIERGAIEVRTSMQLGNIIDVIHSVDVDEPVSAEQLSLI